MNALLDTNIILDLMSRNPKDFTGSPVLVLTPAKLLALFAKAPDA